jgi:hypothetical protein
MAARTVTHTSGMKPLALRDLLNPRPRFTVHPPKQVIATALSDYGEDSLAQRALGMSEEERSQIDRISAWYEMPDYPLPMTGQRITHGHVAAFATITLFEGAIRPLARTRRRPSKDQLAGRRRGRLDGRRRSAAS